MRIVLLLFLFASTNTARAYQHELFQEKGYNFEARSNEKWAMSPQTKTYVNIGDSYTHYLALNADSSFVFVDHHEILNSFSRGYWKKVAGNKIVLDWDKEQTEKTLNNEDSCAKYQIRKGTLPTRIAGWTMLFNKDSLTTAGFEGDAEKTIERIESLIAETQLLTLRDETVTTPLYDPGGNQMGVSNNRYFFDSSGQLRKYIREGSYTDKNGDKQRSLVTVFFLEQDLVKSTSTGNMPGDPVSTCYFSGQQLIRAVNETHPASTFGYVMHLKKQTLESIHKQN